MKPLILTKAQTLSFLSTKLEKSIISKLIFFTVKDWEDSRSKIIEQIQAKFPKHNLIIRSSALGEDGQNESMAGAFESVTDVDSSNSESLISSIEKVIKSYHQNYDPLNEVLVQLVIKNVSMSGVLLTHELNNGSPYYVINYDDESGKTNTVTAGDSEYSNRTLYIYRKAINNIRSKRFSALLSSIQEIEKVMENKFLDVEFALDDQLNVFILQVRFITTQSNWSTSISEDIDIALKEVVKKLKPKFKKIKGVFGASTVFGQMPDWNPAEMIGRAPKKLSYSLYSQLITNYAWRKARKIMGYNIPEGQSLMTSLGGQPFIDTRLSFHSYIPKSVNDEVANKLVDAWVQKLINNPELHDKIEFDVAITTYSFNIDQKINDSFENTLNKDEKNELKMNYFNQFSELLNENHPGSINQALSQIDKLSKNENFLDINKLPELIEQCIKLGTIPFSILARHGFIAKTLLLSLVDKNIISINEVNSILNSINTIATDLVNDMNRFQLKEIDKLEFMEKYGHLRPGTYDIVSPRYDQMSEFINSKNDNNLRNKSKRFELSLAQKNSIDKLINSEGFMNLDSSSLMKYIEQATAAREYAKFIFTRSVSNILEIIANFGKTHSLNREELSHIGINNFVNYDKYKDDIKNRLGKISLINKKKNMISSAIRLPQVLFDEAGVFVIPFQVSQANFITNKKITANCIVLKKNVSSLNLNNKIVIIENADPGYDWIFSYKISGLITKYGGANSHMAIRCAEFNIPAAIGCGEQKYNIYSQANKIMIDCSASLIEPIK